MLTFLNQRAPLLAFGIGCFLLGAATAYILALQLCGAIVVLMAWAGAVLIRCGAKEIKDEPRPAGLVSTSLRLR